MAAYWRQKSVDASRLRSGMAHRHCVHAEALPLFYGKRIRIFPHIDDNGQGYRAAAKWQKQLESVGATVDAFSFEGLANVNGTAVKDLNDLARLQPNELALLDVWEGL
jgi:hypothetical protein